MCCGTMVEKTSSKLQCDQAAHHTAWLVESNGQHIWEFSTRGAKHLKNTLVDRACTSTKGKAGVEQTLAELADDHPKGVKTAKA